MNGDPGRIHIASRPGAAQSQFSTCTYCLSSSFDCFFFFSLLKVLLIHFLAWVFLLFNIFSIMDLRVQLERLHSNDGQSLVGYVHLRGDLATLST